MKIESTLQSTGLMTLECVEEIKYYFDDLAAKRLRPILFVFKKGLLTKAFWQDKPDEMIYKVGDRKEGLREVQKALQVLRHDAIDVCTENARWSERSSSFGSQIEKNGDHQFKGHFEFNARWVQETKYCGGVKIDVTVVKPATKNRIK